MKIAIAPTPEPIGAGQRVGGSSGDGRERN